MHLRKLSSLIALSLLLIPMVGFSEEFQWPERQPGEVLSLPPLYLPPPPPPGPILPPTSATSTQPPKGPSLQSPISVDVIGGAFLQRGQQHTLRALALFGLDIDRRPRPAGEYPFVLGAMLGSYTPSVQITSEVWFQRRLHNILPYARGRTSGGTLSLGWRPSPRFLLRTNHYMGYVPFSFITKVPIKPKPSTPGGPTPAPGAKPEVRREVKKIPFLLFIHTLSADFSLLEAEDLSANLIPSFELSHIPALGFQRASLYGGRLQLPVRVRRNADTWLFLEPTATVLYNTGVKSPLRDWSLVGIKHGFAQLTVLVGMEAKVFPFASLDTPANGLFFGGFGVMRRGSRMSAIERKKGNSTFTAGASFGLNLKRVNADVYFFYDSAMQKTDVSIRIKTGFSDYIQVPLEEE